MKKIHLFLPFLLFILLGVLVSEKINLSAADLGRHIKNGELVLKGNFTSVLRTNLYSSSYSDFPFINHHWGSGVIFYLINKYSGFIGLSFFFTILNVATFWLFFDIAKKMTGWINAFLVSLVLLPLIVSRTEIRPEAFSYFFCGLFWWILQNKTRNKHYLWLLPVLIIIWVNLHVYFFLGLFLICVFLSERIIKGKLKENLTLVIVLMLSVFACLVNPAGLKGALQPLQIFNNYGYRVLENQTILFIDRVIGKYPPNLYFKIGFIFLLASWFFPVRKKKILIINLIFSIFISYLGWTAIRNFTIFGLFALPIVSYNLSLALSSFARDRRVIFFTSSAAILIIFALFVVSPNFWLSKSIGWGLRKDVGKGAGFFKQNELKGPIFNNYDVGSYLVYYLYPKEKVFVDNRPEAYPAKFFTDIYVPMQEDNKRWQEVDKKYSFNVIFFYLSDITPWAQQFLTEKIVDPNWAAVYADNYAIIFLKRNEGNKELIKKFELPKKVFTIK